MAKQKRSGGVSFIRRRGRIIPIRKKSKHSVAKSLGTIGGASVLTLGGLTAAGALERKSRALQTAGKIGKSTAFNKLAKFTKFGAGVGLSAVAARELLRADRATSFDERNPTLKTAGALAAGFAFARVGKRFERLGLTGKFPVKLRDI